MSKVSSFNKRKKRVRSSLKKSAHGKHRLSVFISNSYIYAQLIDDVASNTVAAASNLADKAKKTNIAAAQEVGKAIAEKAKKLKITEVVYDRGAYLYHGKVKALADAARENGLKF